MSNSTYSGYSNILGPTYKLTVQVVLSKWHVWLFNVYYALIPQEALNNNVT